jgi:DNA modification methylase
VKKAACKPIRKIGDLIPDDQNANKGTERGLGMLDQSLRKYGAGRSILVDRNGRTLAGNKTLERAAELGFAVRVVQTDGKELVVVQRKDLDLKRDKAARELAIADNRVAEIDLDWDADEIKRLLAEGADLSAFFSDGEIEALLGRDDVNASEDDTPSVEKAAELQKKWKTARGQLWTIKGKSGKAHRLLCGDSTSEEDVKRLIGKERPVWIWTDPPYGVEYEGKTKDKLRIKNDGAKDLPKLLGAAFACADKVLQEGSPIYVAHPAGPLSLEFAKAFTEVGWRWHQTLVWLKDSIVLGHSDFHYKHEPLLYGWKGKKRHWYGGRTQASVLECDRPKASELHPTSKPVELIASCLANSSKAGDVGYEPFAGSGSTFVAAERTGRVCFGVEIDPKYVAVVLERLSVLGLEPKLEART